MSPQLEEIKSKLDIVDVIGQYVKLQKAGVNYKALCPFHKEKTPSFIVSPSRQIFHCFGCGAGGDIFTFIMKIENIDFKEAVKLLADKAGVELTYENPIINSQKQKIIEINEKARDFFEKQLENHSEVEAYLTKRGLKKETIKEFHLGFAPDDWRTLTNFLLKSGFKPEEILQSGLVISKKEIPEINTQIQNTRYKIQDTDIYDRFRSRIMFPLEDGSNHLVGFTGRILKGSEPLKTIKDIEAVGKYVNTPQTLVFDKSKILYGLAKTKMALHELGSTLLVEGQMDFLMGWQSGLKNIVATSGTSLTSYHLTILKKYNHTLILGFDMDEAGEKAAERSIDLALSKEFEVKILQLSQGKDLADYFLDPQNVSQSSELLKKAMPIMDFYFERAKTMGQTNNLEGKKSIVSYFLPKIKKLVNPLDKAFWLEKISHYVNLEPQVLEDELNRIKAEPMNIIDENEPEVQYSSSKTINSFLEQNRYQILSERILALLLQDFSFKNEIEKYQKYFPPDMEELINVIFHANTIDELTSKSLKQINCKDVIINKIDELSLRAQYEEELLNQFDISLKDELNKQLLVLKKEAIKQKQKQIEEQILLAEKNQDLEAKKELIKQFDLLSKELL
ncbi:MAG: DNA primase [Minisyncoccia bacterium]